MRIRRQLIFLGSVDAALATDAATLPKEDPPELRHEGSCIQPGALLPLRRSRSPWRESRPVERVILGSHPTRADLFLQGQDIGPEHARLYISKADTDTNDFRVVEPHPATHRGDILGEEWRALASGDELTLGPWRFRFEIETDHEDEVDTKTAE